MNISDQAAYHAEEERRESFFNNSDTFDEMVLARHNKMIVNSNNKPITKREIRRAEVARIDNSRIGISEEDIKYREQLEFLFGISKD